MRKIDNPEEFRTNVFNKLYELIKNEEFSRKLEEGVYEFAEKEANSLKLVIKWDNPHFTQLYTDRIRSIYMNLKNEDLVSHINSGEITGESLACMTHQEMNPQQWKELIDKKRKRDENKYTNNTQASTDMFTCRKCKSKRCTYYELQTRSADEPATIFITCLDCGKNWKS